MTGVRIRLLFLLTFAALSPAAGSGLHFNPALLEQQAAAGGAVDLSAFERVPQPPGRYRVEVALNQQVQETRDVAFFLRAGRLQPCLSAATLARYGVNVARYPQLEQADGCADLTQIPDADAHLEVSAQRLLLSAPQAALSRGAREAVAPTRWDQGINALLVNYRFSGAQSEARQAHRSGSDNQFLSLRPGLNLGAWRLRNYSTWSRSRDGRAGWDTLYSYLQRQIVPLRAQLTIGEGNAPGDLYDSIRFRGLQLASDEDMLPDSLKGYAPVVRGIARSQAQVSVWQNGHVIYQTYVAPGAFEIADIYPTGGSGDLYVAIKEADGSEQQLVVPFASVPLLQREGHIKYSLTGGEYRGYGDDDNGQRFLQGTAMYGLPQGFTLYGGLQQAARYRSLAAGVGKNFGSLGALSLDITLARARPAHQHPQQGHAWRLRYGKNVIETGTSVALAGYRYATEGFYSLSETLENGSQRWPWDRRRQRAELTLSQNLWRDAGALTLSAINEDYWASARQVRSLSLSYHNSWRSVSMSLNYSYSRNALRQQAHTAREDRVLALSLSVPLGHAGGQTWANYQLNSARHGGDSQSLGLSGVTLADNNLSWSLRQGYATRNQGSSGSAELDYRGGYGEADAGYAWDRHSRRLSYGLSGALTAHRDGITLSQPLGETVALVKAPGIAGASLVNQTGVRTDLRGYTLVPYVRPFRVNELSLDPLSLPNSVELTRTSAQVIPTRGAVVRADFSGRAGQRALIRLTRGNGLPVPFGATVRLAEETSDYSSIVGSEGEVWLSGLADHGTLLVSWGSGPDSQCRASFMLPAGEGESISQLQAICR